MVVVAIMCKLDAEAAEAEGVDRELLEGRLDLKGERRGWRPSLLFGTSNRRTSHCNLVKICVDSRCRDDRMVGLGLIGRVGRKLRVTTRRVLGLAGMFLREIGERIEVVGGSGAWPSLTGLLDLSAGGRDGCFWIWV